LLCYNFATARVLRWSLAGTTIGWTYHYSNVTLNWSDARKWCQANFTDMVVIQSQRENDYVVSLLPNRTQSPYYWIGITKTHLSKTWTWIGNNSTWIGTRSWARNEPNNNRSNEFCVEIYVKSGPDRGKWNDEKCGVFPAAQCNASSCERGRCVETINHSACLCEPGFIGNRCQTAKECPPLSPPENGYLKCSEGSSKFNTTCQFKCHPGFLLTGSSAVTCSPSGVWSALRPVCATVKCPPLSLPDDGNVTCSDEGLIFNSTCRFKCSSGFLMTGSFAVTCGATGIWSGPRPICASTDVKTSIN
uniref:E-selectin n=1 Tax=Nothobranchius furzeri TaxID=105023 RepID=A0A8C6W0G6_NOTFU